QSTPCSLVLYCPPNRGNFTRPCSHQNKRKPQVAHQRRVTLFDMKTTLTLSRSFYGSRASGFSRFHPHFSITAYHRIQGKVRRYPLATPQFSCLPTIFILPLRQRSDERFRQSAAIPGRDHPSRFPNNERGIPDVCGHTRRSASHGFSQHVGECLTESTG